MKGERAASEGGARVRDRVTGRRKWKGEKGATLLADENAYERNNRWMLQSAARFGDKKIAFISLWNGQGGDGPGGAYHFMEEARRKTARIYWLDTRKLWD